MYLCYVYIVPSGPPEEVTVNVVNSTTIQAAWHPPIYDHQNGKILYYTVVLILSTGSHPTHSITTNSTKIQLPHLRPFSEYSFSVAASTGVGSGPFIEPVTINTPEAGKQTIVSYNI